MNKETEGGCLDILQKEFKHLDELMSWLSMNQNVQVVSIAYCTKREIRMKEGERNSKKFVLKYIE